jgi:cytochrome b
MNQAAPLQTIAVWDLPLRLFHWSLASLVLISFVSIKVGGNWVQWHFYSGYAILTLILWRLGWGFIGPRYARFSSFKPSAGAALAYLRGKLQQVSLGHSPVAAWSVYALLLMVGAQAAGGLFANDDIASEGPMAKFVSKAISDQITTLHRLNENILLGLIGLHLAAIFYYILRKNTNLIGPMITGSKELRISDQQAALLAAQPAPGTVLKAFVLLLVCAGIVAALVNWPAPAMLG